MYCQSNVIQHVKNWDFIERIQLLIIDNSTTTVCCGYGLHMVYSRKTKTKKQKSNVAFNTITYLFYSTFTTFYTTSWRFF